VEFWVAQFLLAVGRWISKNPSDYLQAVLLFDEADMYLPASRRPATKEPMEHLLRRARSAGLGIFLATQSPGDFDYKARDNIRTWFIGRIKEQTAINKMKPMLTELDGQIAPQLSGRTPGEFHIARDGKVELFKAHRALIAPEQIPEDKILQLANKS
jgi:DNA helicase HerA-like ATPase